MSRAERRAERRRARRPASTSRAAGASSARTPGGVGRGQRRVAIVLLATLALVGLAVIVSPLIASPPGQ